MISQEPGEGKESPLDFALWKGRKDDEDTWWPSPWGPGRPGWHIECSAMAETALGHGFGAGGGIDLVFPHHENEIAQSEGAHEGPMAAVWMHNEMLELGDEKMSKSLGNIALLGDVLDRWPAEVVIAFFLTSHYRSRLPFNEARMAEAAAVVDRLANALRAIDRAMASAAEEGLDPDLARAVVEGRTAFARALDDDFNTPEAFAALALIVRAVNRATAPGGPVGASQLRETRHELVDLLDMLGLAGIDPGPDTPVPDEAAEILSQREEARAAGDFARADALRGPAAGHGLRDRRHPRRPPGGPDAGGLPAGVSREVVYGRNPVRELIAAGARPHARGVGARLAARGAVAGGGSRRRAHPRRARPAGRELGSPGRGGVHRALSLRRPARPAEAPRGNRVPRRRSRPPQHRRDRARRRGVGRRGPGAAAPRGPGVTPTVAKASAGAVEHLPVAQIDSVAGFVLEARDAGRMAVGADQEGAEDYRDLAWPDDPVLVMGAEGAGLGPGAGRLRPPRPHPHVGARGVPQHLRGGRNLL